MKWRNRVHERVGGGPGSNFLLVKLCLLLLWSKKMLLETELTCYLVGAVLHVARKAKRNPRAVWSPCTSGLKKKLSMSIFQGGLDTAGRGQAVSLPFRGRKVFTVGWLSESRQRNTEIGTKAQEV